MQWLALLALISLSVLTIFVIVNAFMFPRLNSVPLQEDEALVSILIPARNEADKIAATIQSVLAQQGVPFELIVLDDRSDDDTGRFARIAAPDDPRLSVIDGAELPIGWLGKTWACHQLVQEAKGSFYVFVDADVQWEATALARIISFVKREHSAFVSVWPTQESEGWLARLLIPLNNMVAMAYLPIVGVHHLPWPFFSLANGQCLVFRRQAYAQCGGHGMVSEELAEDMALARRVKAAGLPIRMIDGTHLLHCNTQLDWKSASAAIGVRLLATHKGRLTSLLLSTLFHWLLFLFPWIWLLTTPLSVGWPHVPLTLIGLGIGIRMLSALVTGQRILDAVMLPLSILLMSLIAGNAVYQNWLGELRWKGRVIS